MCVLSNSEWFRTVGKVRLACDYGAQAAQHARVTQERGNTMKKALLVAMTTMAVALTPLVGLAPANAAHIHFGETSRHVAREIGCKHFDPNGGGGMVYKTGVCWLKGKRVNVITFRTRHQQRNWNDVARASFGRDFHWGNGAGALVVARNGNRPAARLGARRLPGTVRHG
jgi:hypothetical protein